MNGFSEVKKVVGVGTVYKVKTRTLRNVNSSVRQLSEITKDFAAGSMELAQVRAAARQAEQAASELNKLAGILEVEFVGQ